MLSRLWYELFRTIIVGPALSVFYSKRVLRGYDQLPQDKPILFVPNHQNSFMDALHVVTNCRKVIHFLTRAEAFKPDLMKKFLRSLKMLPVYRVRDGFSSIQKNEVIFEYCIKRLRKNEAVLIFAEANHDLKRRVRPFSKGFTRIAFGAAKRNDWAMDLQVVPVGINYDRHRKAGTKVMVQFGKAIPVRQYRDLFEEDENAAVQKLKEDTRKGLKKTVMHVEPLEEYPLYHILLDEMEDDRNKLIDPDIVNAKVKKISEQAEKDWIIRAKKLLILSKEARYELKDLYHPVQPKWFDLIFSPVYTFSLLNNALPYQPLRKLIYDMVKDHAFDASIKFVAALVLFPLFYLIIFSVLMLTGVGWKIGFIYLVLSLITLPVFIRAKDLTKRPPLKVIQKEQPATYQKITEELNFFSSLRTKIFSE
ncbi:1-acyl-sn-glycerol-3-phosphate acyltransferase [Balneola sp. MJW-20]|uniref:1-acyl-sn-glycerol-3-phosphate acyltransferase n=1 Tax=Gracilimonas aurantiaca TaxID=3234185 RepID=UPI003465B493